MTETTSVQHQLKAIDNELEFCRLQRNRATEHGYYPQSAEDRDTEECMSKRIAYLIELRCFIQQKYPELAEEAGLAKSWLELTQATQTQ